MDFSEVLIHWYLDNKRNLPWRNTSNPYYIWLSEIIMQQTRVVQGMNYYYAFIKTYPTLTHLACAQEEEVLKLWQGLGYYTRARNLHATAIAIQNKFNGVFPHRYEDILSLKGIGKYTAAAIASFAFKQVYPVVDGNVFRFISRLRGIYTPIQNAKAYTEFETLLNTLIDKERPDLFNHAIMEYGALVCKPMAPLCTICIFSADCVAYKHDKVDQLPVKIKSKQPQLRYFYYMVIKTDITGEEGHVILRKRTKNDIWKNLYEFPCMELLSPTDDLLSEVHKVMETYGIFEYEVVRITDTVKHQLSHRTIFALFIEILIKKQPILRNFEALTPLYKLPKYPVCVLIDRYLKK